MHGSARGVTFLAIGVNCASACGMSISTVLVFWLAAGLLGLLLGSLLVFLIIRTAILGALKAHTRWARAGGA